MDAVKDIATRVDRHELVVFAGSIAYTSGLALAPLLIIGLAISSLLSPQAQSSIATQLISLFGADAGRAAAEILVAARTRIAFRGVSGLIAFFILSFSASAIFSQVRTGLDKIDEVEDDLKRETFGSVLRSRLFLIGLILGFIFLLIVTLFISTWISAVFEGMDGAVIKMVSLGLNFSIFCGLYTLMFHYIPSTRRSWRKSALTGSLAALLFLLGKSLTANYLANLALASAYGAAGSFVVLLLWLYYSSLILLLSYELTNRPTKRGISPHPLPESIPSGKTRTLYT
jgi:membrane protein